MSGRILLCDDEITILRAAAFKLVRSGYTVEEACDGEEAWTKILAAPPDVLVTDLQMPRLNGLELIARLRSHPELAGVRVILLTAKGYELPCQELCRQWDIDRILDKPFSPRELLLLVEQLIAGKGELAATTG